MLPTELKHSTVVQMLPTEVKHSTDGEITEIRTFTEGSKIAESARSCNIDSQ